MIAPVCVFCGLPLDDSIAWMTSLIEGEGAHLECLEVNYYKEEEDEVE